MPKWVKKVLDEMPKEKIEIITGEGDISNLITNGNRYNFDFIAKQKSLIQINTVYFPGWVLKIDGKDAPVIYSENGLIRFKILQGNHKIETRFTETKLRFISDVISIGSLIFVMFLILNKKKQFPQI